MKKSIVVSIQPTNFSALAFKEDFEESIKKVADLGFDGAELAVRNPKDLKVDDVINIIKENNLEVPAIGTGQAYGEEGLSFLRKCTEFAKEYNIGLTLEPVNRYESNFINTLNEGIEFIKRVDASNLGLLADTFHMNIEEVSIYDSIIQAKDYITHVHFADSNRWAPGCGHLNFAKIVQTLKKIDYQGYVSAEILPFPDPDSCARLTAKHLNKIKF